MSENNQYEDRKISFIIKQYYSNKLETWIKVETPNITEMYKGFHSFMGEVFMCM